MSNPIMQIYSVGAILPDGTHSPIINVVTAQGDKRDAAVQAQRFLSSEHDDIEYIVISDDDFESFALIRP
jgi:hypothetical protein